MNKKYLGYMKKGFSLIEVLMTLLIFSVVTIAMAPIITKKISQKKNDGVVYTYVNSNAKTANKFCYSTVNDTDFSLSTDCSVYTFKVPEGVYNVNLTMVAGGGGGGGAAGSRVKEETVEVLGDGDVTTTKKSGNNFIPDVLKSLKVKFLVRTGNVGGKINEDCAVGTECGGRGGSTNTALTDYVIPKDILKGPEFVNALNYDNDASKNGLLEVKSIDGDSSQVRFQYGNEASFGATGSINKFSISNVDADTLENQIVCEINGVKKLLGQCGIGDNNIIKPIPGEYGQALDNMKVTKYLDSAQNRLFGGPGGIIPGVKRGYGNGAIGEQGYYNPYTKKVEYQKVALDSLLEATVSAIVSWFRGKNYSTISAENVVGMPYVKVIYTLEFPGGTGVGGTAGSVVRLTKVPVNPDETYFVVVGKGGKGGAPGDATIIKTSSDSAAAADGSNGSGGTSTAIFKDDGTLLYLVTGGRGGLAGKGRSADSRDRLIQETDEKTTSRFAYSAISSSYKLDENIAKTNDANASVVTGATGRRLIYPKKLDIEPYRTLTRRGNGDQTGSYWNFDKTITINSNTGFGNVYNGLYFRSIIGKEPAYVGGLGGHSGLGGKAGCGGYFMGNFDGRIAAGASYPTTLLERKFLTNKFIVENKLYDVYAYYDKCNNDSPDGTTAEFIAPNPHSSMYGQAGAGGGGGGWSLSKGAGRGGDGQNGYLMIEWRK